MSELKTCPKCGSELAANAPSGICPKCLMRVGLELAEEYEQPTDDAPKTCPRNGFVPPDPDSLSPHFPHLEIIALLGQGGMGPSTRPDRPNWIVLLLLKLSGRSPPTIPRSLNDSIAKPGR